VAEPVRRETDSTLPASDGTEIKVS
jgi:hypothetical protein